MWSVVKNAVLTFRTSLLFVPLIFAIGGLTLSFLTVWLDRSGMVSGLVKMLPGTGIDEEGARGVLSTIASGMLSVTGIVISLTFIALTMMSSQLGPRLLLFFMRDRTTKITIGIFIATILYSLVSMASVGARGDETFAPHLSFVVAIVMAITSLCAMIYFVDHIAHSIQADAVVAQLARECDEAIDATLNEEEPDDAPSDHDVDVFQRRFGENSHRWKAPRAGYLASVDYASLVEAARKHGGAVNLLFRVNTFVFDGQILAQFECRPGEEDEFCGALDDCVALSERRTPAQQINFEMSALTEVALRALSPGINDPNTASACVEYLGNTLSRIARAAPKLRLLVDEERDFRVLRPGDGLPFFLDQCIAPIVAAAGGSPIALDSLVRALNRLSQVAHRERDLEAIALHRTALRELTAAETTHPSERERLLAMIDADPDPLPPV